MIIILASILAFAPIDSTYRVDSAGEIDYLGIRAARLDSTMRANDMDVFDGWYMLDVTNVRHPKSIIPDWVWRDDEDRTT